MTDTTANALLLRRIVIKWQLNYHTFHVINCNDLQHESRLTANQRAEPKLNYVSDITDENHEMLRQSIGFSIQIQGQLKTDSNLLYLHSAIVVC